MPLIILILIHTRSLYFFVAQEIVRGGVSVDVRFNYKVEPETNCEFCYANCDATFEVCAGIYGSSPNNYIDLYAWYQSRRVKWCQASNWLGSWVSVTNTHQDSYTISYYNTGASVCLFVQTITGVFVRLGASDSTRAVLGVAGRSSSLSLAVCGRPEKIQSLLRRKCLSMGHHFVRPRSAVQLRRSLPHGSRPEDGLLLVYIIIY